MKAFDYVRPTTLDQAVAAFESTAHSSFLAGGTTQLDLMKDEVLLPDRIVDITRLPMRGIEATDASLMVGALTTMEELATHATVTKRLAVLGEALLNSASPQLRNMATIGGNLLQRTRCRYFRDPDVPRNKRAPGTGCGAIDGTNRMHAILGTSKHCIATHGSDMAVALTALDATVHTRTREGASSVRLTEFYRTPGSTPDVENVLPPGALIVAIEIPLPAPNVTSGYLKVRDRASYEFALASAAAVIAVDKGVISEARLALGGVATLPWRVPEAERILRGSRPSGELFERAAAALVKGAVPQSGNAYKVTLARRTAVRVLETVSGVR